MTTFDTIQTIESGYFAYYNKRLEVRDIDENVYTFITSYQTKKLTLKEACNLIHSIISL